ncbi:hypothetical protein [Planomonospora sp. ID82291]|uniref:hypothetical protein n=1 Tax=Planomonospora sp. ID82291 TaxID=2738136 RepID=UPI0018C3A30C|nr:hypothetical protein [Planomonospora sp. ID82291]MBG0818815.1 hypothetical protein [Planomonospora sp. ID82291]
MTSCSPDQTGVVPSLFRRVAALRGGRAVHTRGRFFRAAFRVLDHAGPRLGVPVLDEPGERQALVRLSKGASLPGGLPDVLGLAVRLPCEQAPGGVLDLLLATRGRPRWLPFPSTGFGSGVFSTLIPYRHGSGRIRFLAVTADRTRARSADPGAIAETVAAAPLDFVLGVEGRRRPFARLSLHTVLPDEEFAAFDPMLNRHPALRFPALLLRVREAAYAGSRRGRARSGERTGERAGKAAERAGERAGERAREAGAESRRDRSGLTIA